MPISAGLVSSPRMAPVLRLTFDVGHAGGGVEDGEQAGAEVVGEGEEALVAGELVGAEQAAEQADGDFEILDVDVFVEGELGIDEAAVFVGLLGEAHEDHGVEGVDGGHEERGAVPVEGLVGEGAELVVTPGVLVVAVPGVEELGADLGGHFLLGGDGGGLGDGLGGDQEQGQREEAEGQGHSEMVIEEKRTRGASFAGVLRTQFTPL